MRIGEILRRDGLVSDEDLGRALVEQATTGGRICSLLVAHGVLGADDAARALAQQFEVAAALMRHIDNRDRTLANLLPASVARQHGALPLGRLRDGELVICVRDPKRHTQAALELIVQQAVLVTVACAHVLEPLLDAAYGNAPPPPVAFAQGTERHLEEYDVDLTTGPIPTFATELPHTYELADLDEAGVDKQFTLHSPRTPTLPPLDTTRTLTKK